MCASQFHFQGAARKARHRAASLFPGFLTSFFYDFLDFGLPDSHDFERFWRPGGSFFDDFWIFWVPGNPFWRLGAYFDPRLGFLWFWRPLRHENLVLFEVMFWYFLHPIFSVFLSVHFSVFFVIWDAQRLHFRHFLAPFWEPCLGHWKWKRKSVFGLHRRVRIASPAFRKNDFSYHFWCLF